MLDLDADLIPGVSAAGIAIGQVITSILEYRQPASIEPRIGCRVLKYGPVWVFEKFWPLLRDENLVGVVDQVCVHIGYRGKIAGRIGIGSRLAEVVAAFGPLEHIERDEYQIAGSPPGMSTDWCFEVEKGSPSMNEPGWADTRLCCICIF